MPRSIEGVPTLILDYDTDIDMSKDVAAKEHYAGQVQAYFKFVKDLRDKKAEYAACTASLCPCTVIWRMDLC